MPQSKKNRWLILVSVITCLISLGLFSFFLIQSSTPQKTAKAASYNADQVRIAINKERKKQGLKELISNSKLNGSAQKKADDMANKSYFSHISPVDGKKWSDFIKQSGYDYLVAGENLANGFDNVGEMVIAWMNSPSHRENILNKSVEDTGIGISYGNLEGYPTIFVSQVFGKPSPAEISSRQTKLNPTKAQTTSQNNPAKNTDNENSSKKEDIEEDIGNNSSTSSSTSETPADNKIKSIGDLIQLPSL